VNDQPANDSLLYRAKYLRASIEGDRKQIERQWDAVDLAMRAAIIAERMRSTARVDRFVLAFWLIVVALQPIWIVWGIFNGHGLTVLACIGQALFLLFFTLLIATRHALPHRDALLRAEEKLSGMRSKHQ
jgi:hypothetical protein